MIVVLRSMTYDELTAQLNRNDKIVIWSCNDCVKFSGGLGGREPLNDLANRLERDGFNIIHRELSGVACNLQLLRNRTKDLATADHFKEMTTLIVIACDDAAAKLQHIFRKKKIISVGKSVGIGIYSQKEGMRVCCPIEDTGLKPSLDGIPLEKAAKKLGLHAGPF
ncbi:MAG: hypothetical protein ACFFCQ_03105 [Promethearchaeota archaeon]